jgi:hypothetical protein
MPRAARPGERRGGRIKGVPNKTTIAALNKQKIIEKIAKETGTPTAVATAVLAKAADCRKLAMEELEEALPIIKSVVAHFQKAPFEAVQAGGKATKATKAQWNDFQDWLKLFLDTCVRLAPYQSPTFRAIAVMDPQPSGKRSTPDLDSIVRSGDPVAASRAYQRFMQAPRQLALPPREGATTSRPRTR